jgi:hypothetical protein
MTESTAGPIPTIPGSVPGDARALQVRDLAFPVRNIGQSSPYTSDINTMTVTIATSVALSACEAAAITLSGLTGTQTASTASMPIVDVPFSRGTISSVVSATEVQLASSEPATDGYYEGYAIHVDVDGMDVTTGDRHISTVVSYSGSNKLATLATSIAGSATASTSTYALTARPTTALGDTGVWTQASGSLELSVLGTTTLAQNIAAASTTSLVVASAANLAVGGYIMVDSEIMRVDGVAGTTITVTRQRSGTVASPHASGTTVCNVLVPAIQYKLAFNIINPLGARDAAQVGVWAVYT